MAIYKYERTMDQKHMPANDGARARRARGQLSDAATQGRV